MRSGASDIRCSSHFQETKRENLREKGGAKDIRTGNWAWRSWKVGGVRNLVRERILTRGLILGTDTGKVRIRGEAILNNRRRKLSW